MSQAQKRQRKNLQRLLIFFAIPRNFWISAHAFRKASCSWARRAPAKHFLHARSRAKLAYHFSQSLAQNLLKCLWVWALLVYAIFSKWQKKQRQPLSLSMKSMQLAAFAARESAGEMMSANRH